MYLPQDIRCLSTLTNNKPHVSIEGQGHILTLAPGYLHMKIKTCFLRKYWTIVNQILYVHFQIQGNENPWTWCWSHDQDGRHAHIW